MDRLKREWKETQIPEEIRKRARNLAWARINRPAGGRSAPSWAAAATALIAVALLAFIWGGRENRVQPVDTLATSKDVSRPAVAAGQILRPPAEAPRAARLSPVKRHAAPKRGRAAVEEPERIVLNFILPESGARMIWIMDSSFQLNGGAE